MKLALRSLAMFVVVAGLTAASTPSMGSAANPNSVSVAVADPGPLSLPAPGCGPGVPTCPQGPGSGNPW
jgi:hypothetical protein